MTTLPTELKGDYWSRHSAGEMGLFDSMRRYVSAAQSPEEGAQNLVPVDVGFEYHIPELYLEKPTTRQAKAAPFTGHEAVHFAVAED